MMSARYLSTGTVCLSRASLGLGLHNPSTPQSLLHTSARLAAQRRRGGPSNSNAPSRTRLVKDLSPKSNSGGRLETSNKEGRRGSKRGPPPPPPRPAFQRDPLPHEGQDPVSDGLRRRKPTKIVEPSRSAPREAPVIDWGFSSARSASQTAALTSAAGHAISSSSKKRPTLSSTSSSSTLDSTGFDTFSSPPLLPGLAQSLQEVLGPNVRPTPIQSLSLQHVVSQKAASHGGKPWNQFLLASETGSGKSIAYLLPVLQSLKQSEEEARKASGAGLASKTTDADRALASPRALILAPTHELTRQLSGFAKSLLHNVKLRVVCASRANTASGQSAKYEQQELDTHGTLEVKPSSQARPLDVLVSTPSKALEMVRGRGWDWVDKRNAEMTREQEPFDSRQEIREAESRRPFTIGKPEISLANVEWVVVDEADVLFDPDFHENTKALLADIAAARGCPVPSAETAPNVTSSSQIFDYPFNFLLTTATIPSSLAAYLDTHHPKLTRLASPNLHRLPSKLRTEYVSWTSGNRYADVERRIRRVWADEAPTGNPRSKILIFCNRSSKVTELGQFLEEKGLPNVALTSDGEARQFGSNKHLAGFLKTKSTAIAKPQPASEVSLNPNEDKEPHVIITTSLLSRGLDFSPDLKHVFIVDEPRNMVDFLHRAGRSGRAGQSGKVVIFGKMSGRGSERAKDARKRVAALAA